ncbi:hypothetical protein TGRUB_224730 [Toxoplasma gondii RUB]|uniref:Uncharacterized protein n=1 Tax=Toxoplasma gondii RUB TaxID=935652 RepID=A0A086LVQ0_TOXGO|nr:hypothetical protein TGRUB_224730 [Toxoplasma gondii RUB]
MSAICRPRLALAAAKAAAARLRPGPSESRLAAFAENWQASGKPQWARVCEERHFPMLQKLQPCFPLYRDVLAAMEQADFKPAGLVVNSEAQAKLGEFFLCCACALRPQEVESAGADNAALLRVAQRTAEKDFEPWLQEVRSFVSDFDATLADQVEAAALLRAHDEGRFWEASFAAAAPDLFDALVAAAEKADAETVNRSDEASSSPSLSSVSSPPLSSSASSPLSCPPSSCGTSSSVSFSESSPPSGSSPSVSVASSPSSSEPASSSLRGEETESSSEPTELEKAIVSENEDLAVQIYERWLVAVSQPIKRELRDALSHFGLLVVKEELEEAARSRGKE